VGAVACLALCAMKLCAQWAQWRGRSASAVFSHADNSEYLSFIGSSRLPKSSQVPGTGDAPAVTRTRCSTARTRDLGDRMRHNGSAYELLPFILFGPLK
jgi:hypothetical protein